MTLNWPASLLLLAAFTLAAWAPQVRADIAPPPDQTRIGVRWTIDADLLDDRYTLAVLTMNERWKRSLGLRWTDVTGEVALPSFYRHIHHMVAFRQDDLVSFAQTYRKTLAASDPERIASEQLNDAELADWIQTVAIDFDHNVERATLVDFFGQGHILLSRRLDARVVVPKSAMLQVGATSNPMFTLTLIGEAPLRTMELLAEPLGVNRWMFRPNLMGSTAYPPFVEQGWPTTATSTDNGGSCQGGSLPAHVGLIWALVLAWRRSR